MIRNRIVIFVIIGDNGLSVWVEWELPSRQLIQSLELEFDFIDH